MKQKKEIRKKVLKLLEEYSQYNTKLKDYNPFDMLKSYDFFDSEIMFGIDSFDIVIMNPPYFQLTGKHKYLHYFEKGKNKTADIYQLFMETALNKLLSQIGVVSAVVSNKWMRAGYGERTREFLYNNCYVFEIIDLGANWFESATVETSIINYRKLLNKENKLENIKSYKINLCDNIEVNKISSEEFFIYAKDYINSWFMSNEKENSILNKIIKYGKPLKEWNIIMYRGILTGFNEAFIIDEETKNKLILEDKKSKEIIKPLLRGRDIKRYSYDYQGLYLINTHNGVKSENINRININDYPAIKNHLQKYYKQLEKRLDKGDTPYNLRNCAYLKEFEKEKVFCKAIGFNLAFTIAEKDLIISAPSSFFISNMNKYFVGILNSKLIKYFIYKYSDRTGAGDIMLNVQSLEKIPIPEPNENTLKEIEGLVDKVIKVKGEGGDSLEFEKKIDLLVYKLYNLNGEEIKIIESK